MGMFKFGRYAQPKGPYAQYQEPVQVVRSARNTVVKASGFSIPGGGGGFSGGFSGMGDNAASSGMFGGNMGMGGQMGPAGSNGFNVDRYNPVFDQLEEGTILEDWIPRDGAGLDLLFRRIYLRDPVIGPGVDIIRHLPWSDYTLQGITDPGIKKIYEDTYSALDLPLLMPDITGDYLVIGRNIISLIFDGKKGIFSGVVPHDPDFVRVSPLPVYGFDPLCDFKLSPGFRKFLMSTDPRAMDARRALPPDFIKAAQSDQGFLPLDPVSTIYLGRPASQHDKVGTSLLTRVLYFWAIEKALLNAQLSSTRRRARSFVHLMAGIDNVWEPTPEELDALAGMIIQANEDPVGGVVATRTGVSINEPVGGGQDFYKWSDELDLFSKYKMQAIGISEALLSGDATYNNAEQARSVFVENLAILRHRIVNKMFYQKLNPTLARLHGFIKRSKAEIDHNIRISPKQAYHAESSRYPVWARSQIEDSRLTARKAMQIPDSELIMPTLEWAKQLKPNQDEKYLEILERLKSNEYPVTLEQWATAAGLNHKNIETDTAADKKLRAKIESIEVNTDAATDEGNLDQGGAPGEEGFNPEDIPTEESPAPETTEAPAEPAAELPPEVIIPEAAAPSKEEVNQALALLTRATHKTSDMKGVY